MSQLNGIWDVTSLVKFYLGGLEFCRAEHKGYNSYSIIVVVKQEEPVNIYILTEINKSE